jgi:hypothetical protein
MDPGVGIHPFQFNQLALELDGFLAIELGGERVMRQQRGCGYDEE